MAFWNQEPCEECTRFEAREFLKFLGPGLLVTVGFIDPGNWAANVAAGSMYGYSLLWMVTLSTIMLIVLQHNAAHFGIITGLCLSEGSKRFFKPWTAKFVILTAVGASISTALAELLGAAIGLSMLTGVPVKVGALMAAVFSLGMLITNSYRKLEIWIMGFVSLVGLAFLYELTLVGLDIKQAAAGWVMPAFPSGSIAIVMSVLGAVVMPHNLFLHSEIIQSRQWNLKKRAVIEQQLKYEFLDTLFAMGAGWAINSAMIIVAAVVFFSNSITVTELQQAQETLRPLLGNAAAVVFALALLVAGLSSSITAAMAGGSIYSGLYEEPFDIKDKHSRAGVGITLAGAWLMILFLGDPFRGMIWSQVVLSVQLPVTILALIMLTSSKEAMGEYANVKSTKVILWTIAAIVIALNVALLWQMAAG